MFSLKFEKPFVAYYRNGIRSSRLIDLKIKGINCIYSNANEICNTSQIYSDTLLKGNFSIIDVIKDSLTNSDTL